MAVERPDREIKENPQPVVSGGAPVSTPNFGPGITPFNNGDILVDIDGGDIDVYFVVSTDNKETMLKEGNNVMTFKTKLIKKLVESGAWKVYTEGFKLGTVAVPLDAPEPVESLPPVKAPKKTMDRSERPTKR